MSIRTKLALADTCVTTRFDTPESLPAMYASSPSIVRDAIAGSESGFTMLDLLRETGMNRRSVLYALRYLYREGIIALVDWGVFVLSETELQKDPGFPEDVRRCISRNGFVTRLAVAEELDASEGEIARAVYSLRCSGVDIRQFDAEEDVVYWEAMP